MIALPGIAIQDTIDESAHALVYRGMRNDGLAIVIKRLKETYPSLQELACYQQEYAIIRTPNLEGMDKAWQWLSEPDNPVQQWRLRPIFKQSCSTLKLTSTVLGQCCAIGACDGD